MYNAMFIIVTNPSVVSQGTEYNTSIIPMAANPSRASLGTTWSPLEDEEEELDSKVSILMDGEGGGDGEG